MVATFFLTNGGLPVLSRVIHPDDIALLNPTLPAEPRYWFSIKKEVRILRDTCSSKKLSLWNSVLRYQTPNHCLMTSMLCHAPTFLSHLPSAEDTLFFRWQSVSPLLTAELCQNHLLGESEKTFYGTDHLLMFATPPSSSKNLILSCGWASASKFNFTKIKDDKVSKSGSNWGKAYKPFSELRAGDRSPWLQGNKYLKQMLIKCVKNTFTPRRL